MASNEATWAKKCMSLLLRVAITKVNSKYEVSKNPSHIWTNRTNLLPWIHKTQILLYIISSSVCDANLSYNFPKTFFQGGTSWMLLLSWLLATSAHGPSHHHEERAYWRSDAGRVALGRHSANCSHSNSVLGYSHPKFSWIETSCNFLLISLTFPGSLFDNLQCAS